MNRRRFVRTAGLGLVLSSASHSFAGERLPAVRTSRPTSEPDPFSRAAPEPLLRLPATLRAGAFMRSSGDDARYHALVHQDGGAARKALLTTPCSDRRVARTLRALGARDGGGVPRSAWTLRHLPLLPAPDHRVAGSFVTVRVEWEGWEAPRDLASLLDEDGGRGTEFRFGGNEEKDDRWESGCIICLFSCPGGVISNARYSIRDHVRGVTRFSIASDLPPDGTDVTVTLELARSSEG